MPTPYIHYLVGGGLGDLIREAYFHNVLGILKRFKILHPSTPLHVLLMTHNPGAVDLLKGTERFVDQLFVRQFPLDGVWQWERAYDDYADVFQGKHELRFNMQENRSLYHTRFDSLRPNSRWPVDWRPAVGMSYELPLSKDEQDELDALELPERIIVHPGAGERFRSFDDDTRAFVDSVVPRDGKIVVGANYEREDHGMEDGLTLGARQLVHAVRRARGVIASESSVYYTASMVGTPFAMLYPPNGAYAAGDWPWFFGQHDPRNIFLRLPLSARDRDLLTRWVKECR